MFTKEGQSFERFRSFFVRTYDLSVLFKILECLFYGGEIAWRQRHCVLSSAVLESCEHLERTQPIEERVMSLHKNEGLSLFLRWNHPDFEIWLLWKEVKHNLFGGKRLELGQVECLVMHGEAFTEQTRICDNFEEDTAAYA